MTSLFSYTDDEDHGLGWPKHYRIIKGICEGLKYLHMDLETPLYHLDPTNILLDTNMVPKIAGFSLSNLRGEQHTMETITFPESP
jgi:serine/threonine protein kinase